MPDEEKPSVIYVGAMDPSKKNSPILNEPPSEESKDERAVCYWNGVKYSPGAKICSGHQLLGCRSDGTWGDWGSC
ncbi:MAG TPA: hypothetical protein PLX30_08485 [Methanothrix sp.]|nr:hypothetical protein [Methanothrix sp.]